MIFLVAMATIRISDWPSRSEDVVRWGLYVSFPFLYLWDITFTTHENACHHYQTYRPYNYITEGHFTMVTQPMLCTTEVCQNCNKEICQRIYELKVTFKSGIRLSICPLFFK
jgi:hypothetical protein